MAAIPTLKAEELDVESKEYRRYKHFWQDIHVVYTGGYDLQQVAAAQITPVSLTVSQQLAVKEAAPSNVPNRRYFKQYPQEPNNLYVLRISNAYDNNDFAATINRIANALFRVAPSIDASPAFPAWYDDFSGNADGAESSLFAVLKAQFIEASLYRQCGALITKDEDSALPELACYANPDIQYIDFDDDGNTKSVVIKVDKTTRDFPKPPVDTTLKIVVTPTYYQEYEKQQNGNAYKRIENQPLDGFNPFCALSLDKNIWLANKLYYPYINLLNQTNRLDHAVANSCYIQAVVYSDLPPDQLQERISAGTHGLIALPIGSTFEQKSADVTALETLSQHNKDLKDNLHRIVDQMAYAIDSTSLGNSANRSGLSKEQDYSAIDQLLAGYGKILARYLQKLLTAVSAVMGDSTEWTVSGWDEFDTASLDDDLSRLNTIKMAGVHAPTLLKTYEKSIVDKAIDDEQAEEKTQAQAEIDAFYANPPAPEPVELDPTPVQVANGTVKPQPKVPAGK